MLPADWAETQVAYTFTKSGSFLTHQIVARVDTSAQLKLAFCIRLDAAPARAVLVYHGCKLLVSARGTRKQKSYGSGPQESLGGARTCREQMRYGHRLLLLLVL